MDMKTDHPTFNNFLKESPFAWWEWDVEKNHVSFNELKTRMLGYDSAVFRDRGYQAFTELIHTEDLEKTLEAMKSVLYRRQPLYQVDYRIRAKDGTYKWFMDRGSVIERDETGSPRRIRGIVIDLGLEGLTTGSPEVVLEIVTNSLYKYNHQIDSVLVVCSNCKRVKYQERDYRPMTWELTHLLAEQTSHSICPECFETLYPDFVKARKEQSSTL